MLDSSSAGALANQALEKSKGSRHCNFLLAAVFYGGTRENRMNRNHARSHEMILDGWPVLIAFVSYLVAFGIVAMTMVSGMQVA
jgi:hypothetical protein